MYQQKIVNYLAIIGVHSTIHLMHPNLLSDKYCMCLCASVHAYMHAYTCVCV